jgi:uncharacterized membrane protein YebE (DUF533 family)
MALSLPKQAFLALAAVGWADGSFRKNEGAALLRAAQASGVTGEDLAEVERSTKHEVSLDSFDAAGLGEWERVLTYALASWLACLDGVQSTSESVALQKLGEHLGLDVGVRQRAASAAFDIAVLPEGGRPEKYDFEKLGARLREKMPKLGA